jgi:hypothetical protein
MARGLVLSFLALTKVRKMTLFKDGGEDGLSIGFELGIAEGWEDDIVDGFKHSLWLGVELGIAEGWEEDIVD